MLSQIRAVSEAVFATEAGPPPAARLDWLVGEMEDYLVRAGSRARLIFRLALFAVSVVAPLFARRLPPFTALDVATRVKGLHAMEESFASAPVLAVKAFLCVLWYEHPEVQAEVGYVGFGRAGTLPSPVGGAR